MGALAASTASAPARLAASRVASWPPAVSWVCTCTGQVEALAQRGDELLGRSGAQQPGHVLDRQDVRAGGDHLLGKPQVVVERVERLVRVEQVAGVAHGHLGDRGAGREHGVDRRLHLVDVVERVEDAEDVDAGGRRFAHERVGDLGRIRRVADRVAAAQQHLDRDVRQRLAHRRRDAPTGPRRGSGARRRRSHRPRPRPRAGRASSARRRAAPPRGPWCARGSRAATGARRGTSSRSRRGASARAEPRRSRRGRVRATAAAIRRAERCRRRRPGASCAGSTRPAPSPFGLVDRDIREPVQDLGAAVARLAHVEQLGPLLDERGAQVAGLERRVGEHRLQEGDVGGHAPDAELGETATRPHDGGREVAPAQPSS